MAQDIEQRIAEEVRDLPQLPGVVQRVLAVTDDPNTSAADLGEVVGTDQALTARVLRMANSPLFGLARRVDTVTGAVRVLGFNAIRNIVLASHLASTLGNPVDGYVLEAGALWRHALASGTAALVLARQARVPNHETALVAGILQDVGKLVLGAYIGQRLNEMVEDATTRQVSFADIERANLGVDHAEVGAIITENWGLPTELVNVVRYHHRPGEHPSGNPLVWLAHLGDYLAMTAGYGLGGEGLAYAVDARGWQVLNVDPAQLPVIMDEIIRKVQALENLLDGASA
ncbi:MAG: HDOD domain-containing protein [Armatimonadia bacterium]|nr:HDOD domain-containing protein [Armatimonadia bacterium]